MVRRILSFLLVAVMLAAVASAFAESSEELPFAVHNGSRDSSQIAITVDDCYDRTLVREIFDFCVSEGVCVTFFPLGDQLKTEDAELWREIAESPYAEIGSHTQHHMNFNNLSNSGVNTHVRRAQECLDEVLGYHYQIKSLRPPFGSYKDATHPGKRIAQILAQYGYDHIILWDVSQTDPDKAITQVRNGSILLYHARPKDYRCLQQLIPALKEAGFVPVTVSTLLGFEGTGIQPEETVATPTDAA